MTTEMADPLARLEEAVRRQSQEEEAARALSVARTKLVLGRDAKSVFFATLALRLLPEPRWELGTLATDGRVLAYNPEFILARTEPERIGLVAHEVLHNALGHHARRGHRQKDNWNIACDLAVNPLLRDAGFTLPAGGCFPGEVPYQDLPDGLSAEEYYHLLDKPSSPEEGDDGSEGGEDGSEGGNPCPDPGGCGGVMDAGDGSPAAQKESQAEWEVAVAQAHEAASQRGLLPGGLSRLVQTILAPQVDWRQVLREFVSRQARNDYSWTPPNKRFIHMGLYLPGMRSEELGEVWLAVDTSGSIGPNELSSFASEITGILESFDCELTILYHDAAIQHVQHWKTSDGPLVMEPKGGGGTDHHPVFEHIEEACASPACLVCLTDAYSRFPQEAPAYPVLWAIVHNATPSLPWGQVVQVQ